MIEFATVARPYAKALFQLATEKEQVENWLGSLAELAWLMQQSTVVDALSQVDKNSTEQASELLALLSNTKIAKNKEFKSFVQVVAQEKRLAVLPEIYAQYKSLSLAGNHTKEAIVYTAYEIASEGQRAKIISDLEQHFNTRLQATFKLAPELIGGIKVEVDDQVLDLSVQAKLQALYTTLTN